MNVMTSAKTAREVKLDAHDLSQHIGTEIRGFDLSGPLDDATVAAIRKIWLARSVLLFRDQDITQEDLLRFTGYFGNVGERGLSSTVYPSTAGRTLPQIMLISNVRENGKTIGALPDGEMNFHHDMIQTEVPHIASVLYAREVPSYGGDTCFASGHAAYDTLDPKVKAKLEGKRVFHVYQYGRTKRGDDTGTYDAVDKSAHPAFRTHEENGRKAIYVNRLMSVGVEGMDQKEGEELLNAVFDHAEKPEFVYCHKWKVGDLVIWDNRNSMHARTDFPSDQRRLMWRSQAEGTQRPF